MIQTFWLILNAANIPVDYAPFATFAVYAIISTLRHDGTLLSAQAFTSLALIALLTYPLLIFCQTLPNLFNTLSCFQRIEKYWLLTPHVYSETAQSVELSRRSSSRTIELQMLPGSRSSDIIVSFDKASISRAACTDTILHEVTMNICKGITMIIGPVGSGKSTLLEAILGDHVLETGYISDLPARMAYCSQVPWIRNRSIRENITEEMAFDQKWYEFAISASGLHEDLENIPGGDARVTGSSGLTLSGGQKHRIVSCSSQI